MIESEVLTDALIVRLSSPPLNTITLGLLSELRAAIRQASDDAVVRGIVVAGDARNFSAGADVDLFRIKIWDKDTGLVVYDNQMGDEENADPVTAIGGGSIVIHEE